MAVQFVEVLHLLTLPLCLCIVAGNVAQQFDKGIEPLTLFRHNVRPLCLHRQAADTTKENTENQRFDAHGSRNANQWASSQLLPQPQSATSGTDIS